MRDYLAAQVRWRMRREPVKCCEADVLDGFRCTLSAWHNPLDTNICMLERGIGVHERVNVRHVQGDGGFPSGRVRRDWAVE